MLYKYKGYLYMYSEQGIGPHPILQDFRGAYKPSGWSLSFAYFFNKKNTHKATIWDKDGEIVYKGKLTFKPDNKYYHLIPVEIDKEEWYQMVNKQYIMELETNGTILMNESEHEIKGNPFYEVYNYTDEGEVLVFKGNILGNIRMNSILKFRYKEKDKQLYKKFYTCKGYVISIKTKEDSFIITTSENEYYKIKPI